MTADFLASHALLLVGAAILLIWAAAASESELAIRQAIGAPRLPDYSFRGASRSVAMAGRELREKIARSAKRENGKK